MATTCVVIEHDQYPDFSWLEQEQYNPRSKDYEPIYRSEEDMDAGAEPIDGDWYRDPANHVVLCMIAYDDEGNAEGGARVVDSLVIDFLRDSDDWRTGTFYSVAQLEALGAPYLAELAKEMGLR